MKGIVRQAIARTWRATAASYVDPAGELARLATEALEVVGAEESAAKREYAADTMAVLAPSVADRPKE